LSTIRFRRALDNSKKRYHLGLLWGACPYFTPFYLIIIDCWKYCKYCKRYKFALSVARPRAKKLSASGGLAPLTRGSAPGPRWGLRPQTPVIGSRSTRSPCAPQKTAHGPPCSSTLAPALNVTNAFTCPSLNTGIYRVHTAIPTPIPTSTIPTPAIPTPVILTPVLAVHFSKIHAVQHFIYNQSTDQ